MSHSKDAYLSLAFVLTTMNIAWSLFCEWHCILHCYKLLALFTDRTNVTYGKHGKGRSVWFKVATECHAWHLCGTISSILSPVSEYT